MYMSELLRLVITDQKHVMNEAHQLLLSSGHDDCSYFLIGRNNSPKLVSSVKYV